MESIPEQYLKALLEISQQINSIQQTTELLDKILNIALQQLSAERGLILHKDEHNQDELITGAVKNFESQKISNVKDISHSTITRVIETKQPLLTYDALSDERFDAAQSVVLHQIRSIACVPLFLKGEFFGVIYIDSVSDKARLTQQSLAFLQAFANQAAIALENARLMEHLQQENASLKEEFHRIFAFKEIIGKSKAMQSVFQIMGRVLNVDTSILIIGQTGTGKELVARAIHYNGHRQEKPFVPLNCGAIPENLIESELFGHKKGSFTGAVCDKKGLIESADGGTLFLDEIGELHFHLQVKLLRFLQDKSFTPVGDVRQKSADVRIVAATNRYLQDAIEDGTFREDLYYRLNVINIPLPPLQERKKDIPLLAQHFLKKYVKRMNKKVTAVSPKAMEKLIEYSWPGNVRELENTIERSIVMDTDGRLNIDDIWLPEFKQKPGEIQAGKTIEEVSKVLLQKTLAVTEGNKTIAAEMMGVSLRWVHYKMNEWEIK